MNIDNNVLKNPYNVHILYIHKEEKYTVFVLEDRQVRVRKPLRQVQKELAGKNQFIQVERITGAYNSD